MNATLKTAPTRITTGLTLALLLTFSAPASATEPPKGAAASTGPASASAPVAGPTSTTTAPAGAASDPASAQPTAATNAEPQKVVCRDEKVTGSKLRSRKVCSTPDSESKSGDWVRNQQARGAIGASAILNGQ